MSDRIETGAGEVERDAVELAEELRDPRNGSLRAVVRRIESLGTMTNALGDSLRGRIVRGEDRIDALEKAETELAAKLLGHDAAIRGIEERATNLYRSTVARFDEIDRAEIALREKVAAVEQIVAVHGPKIGDINHALGKLAAECRKDFATLDERVERHRRVLSSKIARDAGVSVPAPSSPELEERRGAGPVTFPIPEVRPGRAQPRTGDGARPKPNPGALRSCSYGDTMADGVVHRGLAPCPPPVAGSAEDDVERAARALVENRGATYSVATNPPSKFVMIPSAYFEALRAALLRRSPWAAYDRTPEVLAEVAAVLPPDEARIVLQAGEPSGGQA